MKRVFLIDVLECPCGGRRQIIATITEPDVVRAILRALHLPEEEPPIGHARDPPERDVLPTPIPDVPETDPVEVRLVLE